LKVLCTIKNILIDQWFLIGMVIVIVIAYFTPNVGKTGGPLKPEITVTYVYVILVFLLSGLAVKLDAMKKALLNFKHQICIFLID